MTGTRHNPYRLIQCIFAIFASLSVLGIAHAQLVLFPGTRVSLTGAPSLLPSTAQSDPVATQALRRVVDASGGMEAWKRIRSAQIRLRASSPISTESHELLMLDDWSTDATVYRRGAAGSHRTPREHDGQSTFIASAAGKGRTVAEFDQARVLAGSLPAAAAEIILRKSSYLAKQASGPRCSAGITCIDIYRQPTADAQFVREEEWLISQSSGLPTVIDLILPNLSGTRQIFEEFQFDQMLTTNGVTIPSKTEMHHPSGSVQVRSVVSFTPNAAFEKSAFDKEISK